ncbi:MAG: hypothetical protein K9N23_23540, partial [Akkermansiaceae bacterium]|nr:hypothetical protein [Akkermansiaceae bacterium]
MNSKLKTAIATLQPAALPVAILWLAFMPGQATLASQSEDNPGVDCPCCDCYDLTTAKITTPAHPNAPLLPTSLDLESTDCLRVLEDAEGLLKFTVYPPDPNPNAPTCPDCSHVGLFIEMESEMSPPTELSPNRQDGGIDVSIKKWKSGGTIKIRIFCTLDGVKKYQCGEFCVVGGDCGMCSGSGGGGGFCDPTGAIGSVDFTIPVGTSDFGDVAAYITANFDTTINPGRSILRLNAPPGAVSLTTSNGSLATVASATAIATIYDNDNIPSDDNAYTIDISCDPTDPTGEIVRRIVVATVDNKLQLTSTYFTTPGDGNGTGTDRVMTWSKTGDATNNTWTFTDGGGMAKIEKQTVLDGLTRTEIVKTYENPRSGDILISHVKTEFQKQGGRWKPVKRTVDPDGQKLVTVWIYENLNGYPQGFGQPSDIRYPDYTYESHTYGPLTHSIVRPYGAASATTQTRSWSCSDPPSNPILDTLTDTLSEGANNVISKRILTFDDSEDTLTTDTYASDSEILRDVTEYYPPGTSGLGGKVKTVSRSDGTDSTCEYEFIEINQNHDLDRTLTVTTGTGTDNTVTITRTTSKGVDHGYCSTRTVGSASTITDEWEVDERDHLDRPLTIFFFPSAAPANEHALWTITRGYDCCGLLYETDRHGIKTVYAYDALKRRIKSNTLNVTTFTKYVGLSTYQYRYNETPGSGDSLFETPDNMISGTDRNLAGDITALWGPSAETGACIPLTTYTTLYRNAEFSTPPGYFNVNGVSIGRIVTETTKQTGTVTAQQETLYLRDGQSYQSTGDLRPDTRFSYSAD